MLRLVLEGNRVPHDSRAELFEAVGHPTRIRILQVLKEEPMGFSDLRRALGIESNGNLAFHLDKLRNLVQTNPNGNYALTDDGREALWSIGTITGTRGISGSNLRVRRRGREVRRLTVATVIVAILVLGSTAAVQQVQLSALQGRVVSQEQQIALYVKQVQPFANGQSASIVLGQSDFVHYESLTYYGYNPTPSGLNGPTQVVFDSSGNLWVVDSQANRILEFRPPFSDGMSASLVLGEMNLTSEGAYRSVSANTLGTYPWGPGGAAFDRQGDLWVADTGAHRVVEFIPPFSSGMSASLLLGQRNFSSSIPSTSQSGLAFPSKVVFDSRGDLWVLDSGNNRVLEFKPPFRTDMEASTVIGQQSFTGSSGVATRNGLNCGFGDLSFDSTGNLWVGDDLNNRILEFSLPFTSGMGASLVLGQPNFTASVQTVGSLSPSQAPPLPGHLGSRPGTGNLGFAMEFDSAGDLWATYNDRILDFHPPFTTNMQASLELGQPDLTTRLWVGGSSGLDIPAHPAFDGQGNIWVPDSGNNRVLEFASAYPTSYARTTQSNQQSSLDTGVLQTLAIGGVVLIVVMSLVTIFVWKRERRGT